VGQGHGAQAEFFIGPLEQMVCETEVAAYREQHTVNAVFRKLLQMIGELLAGGGATSFVKRDQSPSGFEAPQQSFGFEP
jgi:hypothetical protein